MESPISSKRYFWRVLEVGPKSRSSICPGTVPVFVNDANRAWIGESGIYGLYVLEGKWMDRCGKAVEIEPADGKPCDSLWQEEVIRGRK